MRSLNTGIKADFIKKQLSPSNSASSVDGLALQFSDIGGTKRPKSMHRSETDDGAALDTSQPLSSSEARETPRKSRPRSLTFTRSKGDSNPKKERPVSHARTKSSDAASQRSLTPSGSSQSFGFLNRASKAVAPRDFITYLQKVRQPQSLEVGRLQKLRQVLRNETVVWVNDFIEAGGMIEIIGLLYRITEVEWR